MNHPRAIATLVVLFVAIGFSVSGQLNQDWGGDVMSGEGMFDLEAHTAMFTNNVVIRSTSTGAVLTADRVQIDELSGDVIADGNVRIQQGGDVWASDHFRYNFKTEKMISQEFRTGRAPVFAAGRGLSGDMSTNRVYN